MQKSRWLVLNTMTVLACTAPLDTTAPLVGPIALADCTLNSVRVLEPAPLDSSPRNGLRPYNRWTAAARQVPGGFGGLFSDNSVHSVYLVDPSQQVEATQALLAFDVDMTLARVKQGRWDFAQLFDWYFFINSQPGGFSSSDIDAVRNRLVYGVPDEEMQSKITFLGSLDLPCDLVMLEVREWPTFPTF